MTYATLKRLLPTGNYDKEEMRGKLDLFLVFDRLSQAQYEELAGLIPGESV